MGVIEHWTVEDWQDWALRVAGVCSTVPSARKGIERAMDDYRCMGDELAGAVEALGEALDLLDNARSDFGDPALKRRWGARRKALRAKWGQ